MITRILLISLFTGLMFLLSLMEEGIGLLITTVLFTIGLAAIFETIRTFKKLELKTGILTIRQTFSRTKSFPLAQITHWHAHEYYINSVKRRHLIVYIKSGEKFVISNYDDVKEYEKLTHYLRIQLPQLQD